jgi:hypothetical protein
LTRSQIFSDELSGKTGSAEEDEIQRTTFTWRKSDDGRHRRILA